MPRGRDWEVEAARLQAEQESRDAAQRLASARAKDDDLRDALKGLNAIFPSQMVKAAADPQYQKKLLDSIGPPSKP